MPKKVFSLTRTFLLLLFSMFSASACASSAAKENMPPEDYVQWLEALKKDMRRRGISQKTLDTVYAHNFFKADSKIIKTDRSQAEFVLTSAQYLNRLVNQKRVENARKRYKENQKNLAPIAEKYGVPENYLIAFWGMESNFGASFGGYGTIEALMTLSYDTRRPEFFRNELYQALKIIDEWQIDYQKLQGSWAGAMGHFQFMPSTFNAYAVDYNQDGTIDIWSDFPEAAASAANYLSSIGWAEGQPWGAEAVLPWNFDYALTGHNHKKALKEWKKLGVKFKNAKISDMDENTQASIFLPDGRKGKAYLALPNFYRIMQWNRSENYALAIGILADYVENQKKWQALDFPFSEKLKTDNVKEIEVFANKYLSKTLSEDGQLGTKTKEAVKLLQKDALLPQDGYPDERLLQRIKAYTPQTGLGVPVPERKLHKGI